jgi:2-keto-4-pentenoate hydratase/2-oxohepta-3-ene-1,7-dioic acid hydratase in catechol pathway
MTLNIGDFLLTGTPHGVGPIKVIDYNYYLYQNILN